MMLTRRRRRDPPRRSRRSVGICGIGDQSNRIAVDGLKAAAVAVAKAVAGRAIGEADICDSERRVGRLMAEVVGVNGKT